MYNNYKMLLVNRADIQENSVSMVKIHFGGIFMNLKIREAIIDDYNSICRLTLEVYKLHLKNRPDVYLDVDNPLQVEYYKELLNSSDVKVFVVEDTDSRVITANAVVRIMKTQNLPIFAQKKFAFIDEFCVKSNYRRNGIGKLLFNYIEDYARKEGALSLQLVVWEFNKDAIAFYENLGMTTRNKRMELKL